MNIPSILTPEEKIAKKAKAKKENAIARLYSAIAQNFVHPDQNAVPLQEMEKIVLELIEEKCFWPDLSFNQVLSKMGIDFDSFVKKHNFFVYTKESDDQGSYDYHETLKIDPSFQFAYQPLIAIISYDTDFVHKEEKLILYTNWVKFLVKHGANLNQYFGHHRDEKVHTTLLVDFVKNCFYTRNDSALANIRSLHQEFIKTIIDLGADVSLSVCTLSELNSSHFNGDVKDFVVWATQEAIDEQYDKMFFGSQGSAAQKSSMHDFVLALVDKINLEKEIQDLPISAQSSMIKI